MAPTSLLVTATAATAALALYIHHLHASLRSQITHRQISAEERKALATSNELESLPQDLLDHPEKYRIIHERDAIPLPLPSPRPELIAGLSDRDATDLFTRLMRRNMRAFAAYLPQSWLMRLLARTPEQKASFSAAHIEGLEFEPGDVACGFYEVLVRRGVRCEMGMSASAMPVRGFPGSFGGRLVTGVVSGRARVGEGGKEGEDGGEEGVGNGDGLWLQTETLQWVGREEAEGMGFVLPLERGAMRWMHELASWGLLVSGRKWLLEEVERRRNQK